MITMRVVTHHICTLLVHRPSNEPCDVVATLQFRDGILFCRSPPKRDVPAIVTTNAAGTRTVEEYPGKLSILWTVDACVPVINMPQSCFPRC